MAWFSRRAGRPGVEIDFRAVAEACPEPMFVHRRGRVLWVNAAGLRAIGSKRAADLVGRSIRSFVAGAAGDLRRHSNAADPADRARLQLRRLDGSTFEAEARFTPIEFDGPATLAIFWDVTAARAMERALAESEARFRDLVEGSIQGVVVLDERWSILFANEAAARVFGYRDAAQLMGLPNWSVLLPEAERRRLGAYRDARARGEAAPTELEYDCLRRDGAVVPIRTVVRATQWNGRFAIQATIFDLSESRAAERLARADRQRLLDFAEASSDWLWETDAQHRFTYISKAVEEITGEPVADQLGVRRSDHQLPADDSEGWRRHLADLKALRPFRDFTYRRRLPSGATRVIRTSGTPVFDERGRFAGYRGSSRDVTAELESRRAVEVAERRLEAALESVSTGFSLWGPDDRLVYANSWYRKQSGRAADILRPGVTFEEYLRTSVKAGEIAEARGREEAWLRERMERRGRSAGPLEVTRGDRTLRIAEDRLEDGATLISAMDVTDERRREERLRQAQKMEAIGSLTGGVAHDFNNLLLVILGNVEALLDDAVEGANRRRMAEAVREAASKGAELVRRLLAYSRKQQLAPVALDVNERITALSRMLARMLGEDVEIRLVLTSEPAGVSIDPLQLETALLSLAVNARDAMRQGGALTFRTSRVALGPDAAAALDLSPGAYVVVAVEDTGCGMSEEARSRAFEPFFTTKEVGEGSGLGLSMVYGFVRQSDGHAAIESRPGAGTRVLLYLPVADAASPDEGDLSEGALARAGAARVVLVAEDEPAVRELVTAQLRSLGFRVLSAADGREALAVLEGEAEVDLLFTDVVMRGGIGGYVLAERARALRPDLPILFTTGFAPESMPTGWELVGEHAVLRKPYRRAELAGAVNAALRRPAADIAL